MVPVFTAYIGILHFLADRVMVADLSAAYWQMLLPAQDFGGIIADSPPVTRCWR